VNVVGLPGRVVRTARRATQGVSYRHRPTLTGAWSQGCTHEQVRSPEYLAWCERLGIRPLIHRKQWEWIYILQVLEEHDMLRPGRRGLGFGVGTEPITAYAARCGVKILATDLPSDESSAADWRSSNEHAGELADLNSDGLCPDELFRANVTFRPVDMRAVPDDLGRFDFVWSSCALEHLGTLRAGLDFFERQIDFIEPGGIGVHTTEYRVEPDAGTLSEGPTVLYQRPQLEELTIDVRRRGHHMRTTFALGTDPEDLHVDGKPFTNTHLRMATMGFAHTSFGLWVQRKR
jgi:hypothetical protein